MTIFDPKTGENVVILDDYRELRKLSEAERQKVRQQAEMAKREQQPFKITYSFGSDPGDEDDCIV